MANKKDDSRDTRVSRRLRKIVEEQGHAIVLVIFAVVLVFVCLPVFLVDDMLYVHTTAPEVTKRTSTATVAVVEPPVHRPRTNRTVAARPDAGDKVIQGPAVFFEGGGGGGGEIQQEKEQDMVASSTDAVTSSTSAAADGTRTRADTNATAPYPPVVAGEKPEPDYMSEIKSEAVEADASGEREPDVDSATSAADYRRRRLGARTSRRDTRLRRPSLSSSSSSSSTT